MWGSASYQGGCLPEVDRRTVEWRTEWETCDIPFWEAGWPPLASPSSTRDRSSGELLQRHHHHQQKCVSVGPTHARVCTKSLQSCLTFRDTRDCSPPGSSVPGILQARILEWVVISSSRGSCWPRDQSQVYCITGRFFTIRAIRGALIYREPKSSVSLTTETGLMNSIVLITAKRVI